MFILDREAVRHGFLPMDERLSCAKGNQLVEIHED